MKRGLSVAVLAATVATLLAAHVSSVHAQPVARIALPRPRGTVPLYPGCNNIALSFPDGTDSQTVVQAVTPAGMVEAMWRHDAALNKFEGFSPPAPQASDLLTVNLWDAVWLCIGRAPLGPTPTPTPAPALTSPTPTPMLTWTPTPAAQLVADLAVTDIFPDNLPQGEVYADMLALAKELAARGAELIAISDGQEALELAVTPLQLPVSVPEWLSPMVCVLPGQLLAHDLTLAKGLNPDHPRGLRKVTLTR